MRLEFGLRSEEAAWARELLALPTEEFYGAFLQRQSFKRHPAATPIQTLEELQTMLPSSSQRVDSKWLSSGSLRVPQVFGASLREAGLGMVVPDAAITLAEGGEGVGGLARWVASLLPADTPVLAVDVPTQEHVSPPLDLPGFADYLDTPPGDRGGKLLNLISLEFSGTPLAELVSAPAAVGAVSWVEKYWPPSMPLDSPPAAYYCLMGAAGSYTDFHVDFGGTSVWYHVVAGKKVFYVAPPTSGNHRAYQAWCASKSQSSVFFPDLLDNDQVSVLTVEAGQTLLIPSGWIHAVHTPEDSFVFGGNFIHTAEIPMQLRVFVMEEALHVDSTFRYPQFVPASWYAARAFSQDPHQDALSKKRVSTLLAALKTWLGESIYPLPPDISKDQAQAIITSLESILPSLPSKIEPHPHPQLSKPAASVPASPAATTATSTTATAATTATSTTTSSGLTISFGLPKPVSTPTTPTTTTPTKPITFSFSALKPKLVSSPPKPSPSPSKESKPTPVAPVAPPKQEETNDALSLFASIAVTKSPTSSSPVSSPKPSPPKLRISLGLSQASRRGDPSIDENDDDDEEEEEEEYDEEYDEEEEEEAPPSAKPNKIKIRTKIRPENMTLKPKLVAPSPARGGKGGKEGKGSSPASRGKSRASATTSGRSKTRTSTNASDSDSYYSDYEEDEDDGDEDDDPSWGGPPAPASSSESDSSDDAFLRSLERRAKRTSTSDQASVSKYGRRRKKLKSKDFISVQDYDEELDKEIKQYEANRKKKRKRKHAQATQKAKRQKSLAQSGSEAYVASPEPPPSPKITTKVINTGFGSHPGGKGGARGGGAGAGGGTKKKKAAAKPKKKAGGRSGKANARDFFSSLVARQSSYGRR